MTTHLTAQQIHPLATSIHSSTDSPSLLMVRDFSISRAGCHVNSCTWCRVASTVLNSQSPNSTQSQTVRPIQQTLTRVRLTIHTHSNFLAVLRSENVVHQCGFAC